MSSTERRARAFSIVTYARFEQVGEELKKQYETGNISAYAFITHDKDETTNDNNEVVRKQEHIHIVLISTSYRTATSVKGWFKGTTDYNGERANTLVQSTRVCKHADGTVTHENIDVVGATYYLVHEDKEGKPLPNKYHYSWGEVESANLDALKNFKIVTAGRKEREDKSPEILQAVMNGENPYVLAMKYGRDFILNYRKYCEIAYACAQFGEMERAKKEREEQLYAEYSLGLYQLNDDGSVIETNIKLREQNRMLIEELAKKGETI